MKKCEIFQSTDRCTNRQADRQTNRQTDPQTDRQTDRLTSRQTDRPTDRQTDRPIAGRRDRQTDLLVGPGPVPFLHPPGIGQPDHHQGVAAHRPLKLLLNLDVNHLGDVVAMTQNEAIRKFLTNFRFLALK